MTKVTTATEWFSLCLGWWLGLAGITADSLGPPCTWKGIHLLVRRAWNEMGCYGWCQARRRPTPHSRSEHSRVAWPLSPACTRGSRNRMAVGLDEARGPVPMAVGLQLYS